MTPSPMDERERGSYLRRVSLKRPSRWITLATVASACVLAAGGYVFGHRSDIVTPPASVPFQSSVHASRGEVIVVPSAVEMPKQ